MRVIHEDDYRRTLRDLVENQEKAREEANVAPVHQAVNLQILTVRSTRSLRLTPFSSRLFVVPCLTWLHTTFGVQPMSGPTGLIFAMKSKFTNKAGEEALLTKPQPSSLELGWWRCYWWCWFPNIRWYWRPLVTEELPLMDSRTNPDLPIWATSCFPVLLLLPWEQHIQRNGVVITVN